MLTVIGVLIGDWGFTTFPWQGSLTTAKHSLVGNQLRRSCLATVSRMVDGRVAPSQDDDSDVWEGQGERRLMGGVWKWQLLYS